MLAELLEKKNCEKLTCVEHHRPMSINQAIGSIRANGDYYFRTVDTQTGESTYMRLDNVKAVMDGYTKSLLKPCDIVDGNIVELDKPCECGDCYSEDFEELLLVSRCPNGAELGRQSYHAVERVIAGQGVIEHIKLAYLV